MISEKKFSAAYTSFWSAVTPLADRYVRLQNAQLPTFASPLPASLAGSMRGFANELAFRIFCRCHSDGVSAFELDHLGVSELAKETSDFIARFRESSWRDEDRPVEPAIQEARMMAQRLLQYYKKYDGSTVITLRPELPGVGILDACAGDVLAGETLYEIKAGDRSFRVVDVRQALVYCALNYAAGVHRISQVTLLNPRTGTYFSQPLTQLTAAVAGASPAELFADILEFVERGYDAPSGDWRDSSRRAP